jgi:hypothetical protein
MRAIGSCSEQGIVAETSGKIPSAARMAGKSLEGRLDAAKDGNRLYADN